jgi:hypothetical protein
VATCPTERAQTHRIGLERRRELPSLPFRHVHSSHIFVLHGCPRTGAMPIGSNAFRAHERCADSPTDMRRCIVRRVRRALLACLWLAFAPRSFASAEEDGATVQASSADSSTTALEVQPSEEEEAELAWANLNWRDEGAVLASLHGELGIFDPNASSPNEHALFGGGSLQIAARLANWPMLLGLGGGATWTKSTYRPGPAYFGSVPSGDFYFGPTTQHATVELRHVELLVRVQPWWGRS